MALPTNPVLPNSFQSFLGSVLGTRLDQNFEELVTSINECIANIAYVVRDDGAIRNQSVHADAFTSDALALMAGSSVVSDLDWRPLGFWATATLYRVGNIVETGSPAVAYVCSVQHTSGVFATDYAAGDWVVLSAPRTLISADVTTALGYVPVNVAGDTMTGALTLVTGSDLAGLTISDTLMATQDLLTVDKGIYVAYESSANDIVYGVAANVLRTAGNFLTVGSQCSAIVTSGITATAFGSNFNAVGLNGYASALVGQEIDVASFTPNNTSNKYGLNIIFFDRTDGSTNPGEYSYTFPFGTYTSAGGGLGNNTYNKNAKAIVIESQQRSATGEYCGFMRGIEFGEYSLDSEFDAAYAGSRAYPIGINFSGMHYYGGTDPVTAFNLEAAIALRDFQSIWWNRDPATAATATNKVRTYFNAATGRFIVENGGTERFGVDVSTGGFYQNGALFSTVSLSSNNTWTGTNTFNNSVTIASNLGFTGNARRITGDFSNATVANRVLVQTSSLNSATEFGLIPNGTGGVTGLYVMSAAAANNCQVGRVSVSATQMEIASGVAGAASYVPMVFSVNGTEGARLAVDSVFGSQLLINTSTPSITQVRLRVNGMIACDSPGAFSVHRNGVNTASVANNTPTVIDFTTEEFDTNNLFDTATDRFTPPLGKYTLSGCCAMAPGVVVDQDALVVTIYKNGVAYKSGNITTASGTAVISSHVTCLVDANGTDYFQLVVTQVNAGATGRVMGGGTTDTWFQGYRIA